MRIILIIACSTTIILQVFRILWLFWPTLLQGTKYYSRKEPTKVEKLLYYVAMISILAYAIVISFEQLRGD